MIKALISDAAEGGNGAGLDGVLDSNEAGTVKVLTPPLRSVGRIRRRTQARPVCGPGSMRLGARRRGTHEKIVTPTLERGRSVTAEPRF